MNPDPLRPVETDAEWLNRRAYARERRERLDAFLFVIALAVIVAILVAWAVR